MAYSPEPQNNPEKSRHSSMLNLSANDTVRPAKIEARLVPVADFDRLIAGFDGVVLEMTALFAMHRWPDTTLYPWIFQADGTPVAAALVMLKSLPLGLGRLAVVKWGPILRDACGPDREHIYRSALQHLQANYGDASGSMLSVMPHAEAEPPLRAAEHLAETGFKAGSQLLFPARYLVKVRLSDAEQRKSFAQKWRYHLNKSEKEGLVFEVADTGQFPRFARLYEAMTDRKKFPDFSAYDTLHHHMDWDVPALRPQLFFVTLNREDIAGAVIFTAGRTAVYLYGATNDKALPLRAGYFMHARIIAWLRDNSRAEWYDLGGTDGFQGLHQFKKGMAGTAGRIVNVPPICNYAGSLRGRIVGNAAYAARDAFQKLRKFKNNLATSDTAKPDQERPA
jgi:Acetyltransferase (GNAT) domain